MENSKTTKLMLCKIKNIGIYYDGKSWSLTMPLSIPCHARYWDSFHAFLKPQCMSFAIIQLQYIIIITRNPCMMFIAACVKF